MYNWTYRSAEREQRRYYLRDVLFLPQIYRLKNVDVVHTVILQSFLKPVTYILELWSKCAVCHRCKKRLPTATHRLIFSIILNCPPLVLIFGTDPGEILFIRWHRTWPSLSTSSKVSPGGNFLPMIDSIHSCASLSCSGLRFDAICEEICKSLNFSHLEDIEK